MQENHSFDNYFGQLTQPQYYGSAVDGLDPTEMPAAITRAALEHRCASCVETLEIFVEAYGAEAGNAALRGV